MFCSIEMEKALSNAWANLKPHWGWLCDLLGWEMNKAVLLYRLWVDMMCLSLAYQQNIESNEKYPQQCTTTWKNFAQFVK